MIITYQGDESFRISHGEVAIAVNPVSKAGADLTLLTHSGNPNVARESFVIEGPGEYEVKDIIVKGFLSQGPQGRLNTIYMITFEGMNLCFLGALANPALEPKTLEALEDIDILFVPANGGEAGGVLDPAAAYKLAVSLEPKVIIPMHYSETTLKQFIKESGESADTLDKLVVKKKDLDGKEGDVMVLKQE